MLTRAIEAASMGSINLVQQESVNRLWGGEDVGVFTFDEGVGPGPDIQRILADHDRYGTSCVENAVKVREAFSKETIASRLFRFSAAVAANLELNRTESVMRPIVQRSHIFVYGPRPLMHEAKELCRATRTRLNELYEETQDPIYLNQRAREIAILQGQATFFNEKKPEDDLSLEEAIADLRLAITLTPDSLVPQFNLLRILIHLTDGDTWRDGIAIALEILDRPVEQWQVDVRDDIYPYDFFIDQFNGRAYLDEVCVAHTGDTAALGRMRVLIIAAVNHYMAIVRQSLEYARAACIYDPVYPAYQMTLANVLASRNDAAGLTEARGLFDALCNESMYLIEALYKRNEIDLRLGRAPNESADPLADVVEQAERSLLQTQSHHERMQSEFFRRSRIRADGQQGGVYHKRRPRIAPRVRLSIVISSIGGRGVMKMLRGLANQTIARVDFEVIYVETMDVLVPGACALADTVLTLAQDTFLTYRSVALNEGLAAVNGDVVAFVDPRTELRRDFVARILECFFSTPLKTLAQSDTVAAACVYVVQSESKSAGTAVDVVSCPTEWAHRVRGFDNNPFFSGRAGQEAEFAWRLEQAGLPSLVNSDGGSRQLRHLKPWWDCSPWRGRVGRREISNLLWPELCSPKRSIPLQISSIGDLPLRHPVLLSVHGQYNIVACHGRIYGVRQDAGSIDFTVTEKELWEQLVPEKTAVADTLIEVYELIDNIVASGERQAEVNSQSESSAVSCGEDEPVLVDKQGLFNIVLYRDQYYALHQRFGPFDLKEEILEKDTRLRAPMFLTAASQDDLKSRIENALVEFSDELSSLSVTGRFPNSRVLRALYLFAARCYRFVIPRK
jgi:hypothetical protein